jgi:hypothetical protein
MSDIANDPDSRYWIILLLGSYDRITWKILENLRESLSQDFMGLDNSVLILLLNNIEIYAVEIINNKTHEIIKPVLIVEKFDNTKRASLYFIDQNKITEIEDINLESISLEDNLMNYLQRKYQVQQLAKLPILSKLDYISTASTSIFLIRHEELTRGGEYIELVHLLHRLSKDKLSFIKREGFDISTMAWEILESYNIRYRTYITENSLLDRVKGLFVSDTSKQQQT